MPTTTIHLTSADDTYTTAAGDYSIYGEGGNDTITTGAGNSSVYTGAGNSTITTGAGNSIVSTGLGNQTITTGAGDSTVTTLAGNSTITTGAGNNTVTAGNGNNTITTGAGLNHVTTGIGADTITTGAGDAVVDSGTGNDIVTTGAGNDLIFYHVTNNQGTHSVFTAGAGIDTLNLVMTLAEWKSTAVQADIVSYMSFLAAHKGAAGQDDAAAFNFGGFGLTASQFEKLAVTVDGVLLLDPTKLNVIDHSPPPTLYHGPVANPDYGVVINANGTVPVSFSPIHDAYQIGVSNEYVITNPVGNQIGALWSDSKVSLDKSFSISASLFLGNNPYGADGISFVIQNQSKSAIGLAGEGLGYEGIKNSVGVEFDTYYNAGTKDIVQDHEFINTGGMINAVSSPHILGNGNIKDGNYHPVTISWNAPSEVLKVFFDGARIDKYHLDVAGLVGSTEAYIGFTGSTGGSNNLQKINTLSYKSSDSSVVLDVLVNDTDIDKDQLATLKVILAASEHHAQVSFSGVAGTGIIYSPGHAFDYLAAGVTATDKVAYTISDSHGLQSDSFVEVTIVGVPHLIAAA